jgi:hypothetical protein
MEISFWVKESGVGMNVDTDGHFTFSSFWLQKDTVLVCRHVENVIPSDEFAKFVKEIELPENTNHVALFSIENEMQHEHSEHSPNGVGFVLQGIGETRLCEKDGFDLIRRIRDRIGLTVQSA